MLLPQPAEIGDKVICPLLIIVKCYQNAESPLQGGDHVTVKGNMKWRGYHRRTTLSAPVGYEMHEQSVDDELLRFEGEIVA